MISSFSYVDDGTVNTEYISVKEKHSVNLSAESIESFLVINTSCIRFSFVVLTLVSHKDDDKNLLITANGITSTEEESGTVKLSCPKSPFNLVLLLYLTGHNSNESLNENNMIIMPSSSSNTISNSGLFHMITYVYSSIIIILDNLLMTIFII